MKLPIQVDQFRIHEGAKVPLADHATSIGKLYQKKSDYREWSDQYREEINELQERMYAQDRYSLLLIFQAMDAAGKDSTIQHVMSGINPHGVDVTAFKRPSDEELDHDYLWRTNRVMPRRGHIGIFNRSYYEEVLIARVHPTIVTSVQKLPDEFEKNLDKLWKRRFQEIVNSEEYAYFNGMRIVKLFLHVSKDEQRERFLSRLDSPEKQWKFSAADLEEREHWDEYMHCYEECIHATSTARCPWYVVPADDKKNMRLIVSQIVLETLQNMKVEYPQLDEKTLAKVDEYRKRLTSPS